MMRWQGWIALCVTGVIAVTAYGDLVSTFDAGAEGWFGTGNGASGLEFVADDGIPAGAVRMTDAHDGYAYVGAPAAYLSAAGYRGWLAFDLRTATSGPDAVAYPVQVAVEGAGLVLIKGLENPDAEFTRYFFFFHEDEGWRLYPSRAATYLPGTGTSPTREQVRAVFDGATGIFISADYTNGHTGTGTTEQTTIDNVELTSPSGPLADMDCNGEFNVGDVGPFVLALTEPKAYAAAFPECDIEQADQNADGLITVGDIGIFVRRLTVR